MKDEAIYYLIRYAEHQKDDDKENAKRHLEDLRKHYHITVNSLHKDKSQENSKKSLLTLTADIAHQSKGFIETLPPLLLKLKKL